MPQGHVFVKIDFWNAFNTLRRDVILEAVEFHLPELPPYASASYSGDSDLQFGGVFTAVTGGGAAEGPARTALLLCLAVHDLLTSLQSSIVVGYLDDMSMGAEADRVAEDFTRLEAGAASSASHSTDPSVRSPGSPMRRARIWPREGGASGDSTGGLDSP